MKYFLLIILFLNISSCASYFARKSCEATNWFDYGQKVAMEGRRLTGDAFVNECYKADADIAESDLDRGFKAGMQKYCLPDTVFQNGKNGIFFSEEMCTGQGLNNLRTLHKNGVIEYCDSKNGYSAGAKGKAYNKICPADLEKAFLPEFNRGRRKYLGTVLSQNNSEIRELEQKTSKLENELSYKRGMYLGLQSRSQLNKNTNEPNPQLARMQSEINSVERELRSSQAKIKQLKEQNKQIEIEVVQLEN